MSLLRAELRRLFKRRFTRLMLVAVVLVLAAIAVGTFLSNEDVGPETIAAAEARAEADYQEQRRHFQEFVAECRAAQDDPELARDYPDCDELAQQGPRPENFEAEWFMPPTYEFREKFGEMITAFAGVLALFGFVAGASFIGAEWNTGGMMNLLLWRPRRLRVLATKLAALLGSLTGLTALLGAAWTGAFWFIASQRGVTDAMTSGAWQSFGLTGLRALGLVLATAAIGFGLASLGRHTAMAMGAAIGVFVVGVVGVGIALGAAGVPYVERWLWPVYLWAWMNQEYVSTNYEACVIGPQGFCEPATYVITWQHGGIMLGAAVVVILFAAAWQMRRRDITG